MGRLVNMLRLKEHARTAHLSNKSLSVRHEADRLEQEARGCLERQKIRDEAAAEEARRALLETRVQLAALESCGQATADAKSRADAARIQSKAAVELAKLHAEATKIETVGLLSESLIYPLKVRNCCPIYY